MEFFPLDIRTLSSFESRIKTRGYIKGKRTMRDGKIKNTEIRKGNDEKYTCVIRDKTCVDLILNFKSKSGLFCEFTFRLSI